MVQPVAELSPESDLAATWNISWPRYSLLCSSSGSSFSLVPATAGSRARSVVCRWPLSHSPLGSTHSAPSHHFLSPITCSSPQAWCSRLLHLQRDRKARAISLRTGECKALQRERSLLSSTSIGYSLAGWLGGAIARAAYDLIGLPSGAWPSIRDSCSFVSPGRKPAVLLAIFLTRVWISEMGLGVASRLRPDNSPQYIPDFADLA